MPTSQPNKIEIYTDGACSGNPGNGGWGAVLLYNGHEKKISGSANDTTNNRMELMAVIEGLKAIKSGKLAITIFTDSKYVQNGITSWIHSWKKNGWRGSNKKPVKNVDLWQDLDQVSQKFNIDWQWVKGHAGNKYNEIADQLATSAVKKKS